MRTTDKDATQSLRRGQDKDPAARSKAKRVDAHKSKQLMTHGLRR